MKPVVIAITSLDFIWNFNSFGLVYVLTEGGPGGKTMLPMLFAYQRGVPLRRLRLRRRDGQRDGVVIIVASWCCLPAAAAAGGAT